jgi:hypothetical protein
MSSEIIIQIIACEKYEGFQHLNFDMFSQKKSFQCFNALFNDETEPRVSLKGCDFSCMIQ